MENFVTGVSLLIFIPLIGLLINLFFGKRLGERGVGLVAVGASFLTFIVSLLLWAALADMNYEATIVNMPIFTDWISIPSAGVDIPWQFRVDTLSVTMMLVVTGVGSLIHLYAVGYMHGDERFPRFFVYLNLFLFFMLILVTGNNFLMMFVGWEGVGLCSFLLIGFWFDRSQHHETDSTVGWYNSNAARKAFIVNRIGDFGLLLAMFLIWWTFGTLDYYKPQEDVHVHFEEEEAPVFSIEGLEEGAEEEYEDVTALSSRAGQIGVFTQTEIWFEEGGHEIEVGPWTLDFETVILLITLFILLGATGKSAQIPLFVWLPDAMAGPTPVSALIHAATMVTAGLYLMTRSNSMFHHAEFTSFIVTMIGISTAFVAGFIALGQWDIKKVLAYSTVSQLGFMVTAIGLGAYAAAIFHLVTHAFFKALLFLASGSVIHGVEHGHHHVHEHGHDVHHEEAFDPQDMRNMGGLAARMPLTYWTFVIGGLALAGVFPFAGFWSKDEILADSFVVGFEDGLVKGYLALAVLLLAAAFTGFYTWRLIRLTFHGAPRTEAAGHAPESVWTMTVPLLLLAIGSTLAGFLNIPDGFPLLGSLFGEHELTLWLEESVIHAHAGEFNFLLALLATGVALGAIAVAHNIYSPANVDDVREAGDPLERDTQTASIFALSNAKLYWDETYYQYIVFPFQRASRFLGITLDWNLWHDFFHNNIIRDGFQGASELISYPLDRQVIDRGFLGIARSIQAAAGRLRTVQTGYVRTYALSVLFGAVLVVVVILLPVIRDLLGV
ncbi:MAG: NADH-quinone oxidoreductase subunit L [Chloroflexi bacterium]|nr:NADH-quinone oxidoreductase subunit L [Chloroflexota bacterium]